MHNTAPTSASPACLAGGGEMGALMRAHDWAATPLGPVENWPQPLCSAVGIVLGAASPMGIYWGAGLILLYNDAWRELIGGKHPRALGRPAREVFPEIWEAIGPMFADVMSGLGGGEAREQLLPLDRCGAVEDAWFDYSFSPIPLENGKVGGVLNLAFETSARVKAERALRELNETLEVQVAERTAERDRIWQVSQDMLGVAGDEGIWLSVNPAWTRTLGWDAEEIVGRTSEWLEHPEDHEKTRAEVERLAQGHTTLVFENRIRGKDGRYHDLSWTAVPVEGRLYCVARDITEEKKRARALLLHEEIVQSTRAPICAFNAEYRLISFNRAHADEFFRVFGHRAKMGEVLPDFFPSDQAAVLQGFMARALAGESFIVVEEFGDSDLAKPFWEVSYAPLRDAAGKIVGAFHQARDISARLRAEAELAASQEQLRQSQKMEAVGQLTGGIAHDFNNMLQAIGGALELMQRRILQGRAADVDRYGEVARATVARAAALTHRLLTFARRQALQPEVVNSDSLIAGTAELIRGVVEPGVVVDASLLDGNWPILCDPNQLENVLLNLALNARDAMPDGGRITITTSRVHLSQADVAGQGEAEPGDYVEIAVADTGVGMDEATRARAFEPFFTTKPIGQGTGLGLSQLYGFAQQSGGLVRLDSAPGQGTTVRVYLPRHQALEATAEVEGDKQQSEVWVKGAGAGETILLVEDEAEVRSTTAEHLRELGYRVLDAVDGRAALRHLRSSGQVDLLVTDVGLPGGMNGRQVADAARERRPGLPVLFVTGYAGGALEGQLAPGMEVLTKPFALDALAARMRA